MELKFNDAKSVRPGHLERCLCYDKFLKGYRCYVYDDISKYWCTQATTEHDPDGENHIVDYADFQVTEWASLSNVNKPSLPSGLDEAAEKYSENILANNEDLQDAIGDAFKAGAEWMAGQGQTLDSLIWRDEDDKLFIEAFVDENKFKMAENVTIQIRKKQ